MNCKPGHLEHIRCHDPSYFAQLRVGKYHGPSDEYIPIGPGLQIIRAYCLETFVPELLQR
jgi:hypothetical protein